MTDFKRMNKKELKHYLSTHRNEEEFSAALGERLNRRDPNAKRYPANMPFDETGGIIDQKVKELNENEEFVREKLKYFRQRYRKKISEPYIKQAIEIFKLFNQSQKITKLECKTNKKCDEIQELAKELQEYIKNKSYRISKLEDYINELDGLNEILSSRTSYLDNFRLVINVAGTFLSGFLAFYLPSIDIFGQVNDSVAAIVGTLIGAGFVLYFSLTAFSENSELKKIISNNKAFIVFAKRVLEAESE